MYLYITDFTFSMDWQTIAYAFGLVAMVMLGKALFKKESPKKNKSNKGDKIYPLEER